MHLLIRSDAVGKKKTLFVSKFSTPHDWCKMEAYSSVITSMISL